MSSTADIDGLPGSLSGPALDDATFAALYLEHRAALHRYIVSKTRDPQRAEDLVQDVFAKAYAGRERYDPARPFWPWLASIAARECIDHHRRFAYAQRRLSELERWARDDSFDFTSAAVLQSVERRRIVRALDRLPMRQRAALQLVALDQWSYADVAEHLGYSVSMVKSLVVRARRKLRDLGTGTLGAAVFRVRRRWDRAADRVQPLLSWPVSSAVLGAWSAAANPAGLVAIVGALGLVGATASPAPGGASATVAAPQVAVAVPTVVGPEDPGRPVLVPTLARRPVTGDVERAANEAVAATVPGVAMRDRPDSMSVSSFEMSPHYEDDHTVFAVGASGLGTLGLPGPLLVSHDGGASWQRLRALGLGSFARLLLPPSYPADRRIFALTNKGLQASFDDGLTFETLAPLPDVHDRSLGITGAAAAISPHFDLGHPSILVVAASRLWEYRADRGTLEVLDVGTALAGHELTSVAYLPGPDRAFVLGSVADEGSPDSPVRYSSRCVASSPVSVLLGSSLSCEPVRLDRSPTAQVPLRVTTVPGSGTVYVVYPHRPFVSFDGGRTFRAAREAWGNGTGVGLIHDFSVLPSSGGRSAVLAQIAGLARTDDAGRTWSSMVVDVPGFGWTWAVALAPTGRLLAGGQIGLACSEDGGRTWARLCPTADTT